MTRRRTQTESTLGSEALCATIKLLYQGHRNGTTSFTFRSIFRDSTPFIELDELSTIRYAPIFDENPIPLENRIIDCKNVLRIFLGSKFKKLMSGGFQYFRCSYKERESHLLANQLHLTIYFK